MCRVMGVPEESVRGLRMACAGLALEGSAAAVVVVARERLENCCCWCTVCARDCDILWAIGLFWITDGARKSRYSGLAVALRMYVLLVCCAARVMGLLATRRIANRHGAQIVDIDAIFTGVVEYDVTVISVKFGRLRS